ncbi:MAG: ABC-F family ATP-binding cassette domain-containing protein [bacterium]
MIQINDIKFGFGGKYLMEGLCLHIRPGDRLGLVGPNGSGKTTLMRMVCGEIESFDGTITRRKGLTVGLLPQEGIYDRGRSVFDAALETFADLVKLESEIEKLNAEAAAETDPEHQQDLFYRAGELQNDFENRGGFGFRARTAEILTGLGFPKEDFDREIGTLSGGWQMRVALARLLLQKPDVLLLDEPTNHLDLPALVWFEGFLMNYPGSVVLISHDRCFIDRVARRIAEFHMRKLDLYNGNYSYYEIEKEKRTALLMNRIANQEREIKRTEQFIDRFRYKATKARQVQSRIKKLEKIDRIEAPEEARSLTFSFGTRTKSGKVVMQLAGVSKAYGEKRVLNGINLTVNRGDRVAIIGANGLGKSTLMRVIAGRTEFTGERKPGFNVSTNYFSQDQYELLSPDKTVLEEATEACGAGFAGNVRSLLGVFMFTGSDVIKKVASLSGGEKSRLLLAKMMANPANFLLLDEPTNHLDPPSREMLELVLSEYDGTLCFVSHDRYFINRLATIIVDVTPNGIDEYIGDYGDYEEQKKLRELAARGGETGGGADSTQCMPGRKSARRDRAHQILERSRALAPLKDSIAAAEEEIHRLEARIAEIEKDLADPATYNNAKKARTLPAELKNLKRELEITLADWESLSEQLVAKEKEFDAESV